MRAKRVVLFVLLFALGWGIGEGVKRAVRAQTPQPMVVTTNNCPPMVYTGQYYTCYLFTVTGGTPPYHFVLPAGSTLPPYLQLDPKTGEVYGYVNKLKPAPNAPGNVQGTWK